MARRSSWFAVALVLALLFVTSHCLRGPATRDETRDTTLRSRGVSRFSTKATEGLETTPEPFTSTTRSPRRGTKITNRANTSTYQRSNDPKIETNKKNNVITKAVTQNIGRRKPTRSDDLSRAASEDRRYLPEPSANRNSNPNTNTNNNRNEELLLEAPDVTRAKGRGQRNLSARNSRIESQTRSDSVDPIDDATEKPKFRSGRKIHATTPSENFKESSRFSSRTTESSLTLSNRSGRVVKSDVRRSTERNLRRQDSDLSNSNQVNVSIPFSTEGPTAPSRGRKASGRARSIVIDKSETFPVSARGSKRIPTKKVDGIDGNSLDEFEDSKRKPEEIKSRKSLKSIESTSASSRRSRGRSIEPRSETPEKFKVEAGSRDIASDKNKLDRRGRVPDKVKLVKSNYLGTGSSRSRSRSQTKQSVLSTTESSKEFITSTTYSSTTLLEEATTLSPSTLPPPTELPSTRRASKLAQKTPPKEDYFNRGLGFRGRKFLTPSSSPPTTLTTLPSPSSTPIARIASGWTLNRRPYVKTSTVDLSTTTSNPTTTTMPSVTTISNEISVNDPASTTTLRPRGNKVFNKASIIVKVDREIDDSDNYPPEFKAKFAQLKNNSVKESGSESSPRVIKDVTISRQTRSIEPTDLLGKHTEVNDSSEGTNSSATPFAKLESYTANEGPKNLGAGNTSFAARSRLKLVNAQRQVKPELEPGKNSSSSGPSIDGNENSKKQRTSKRYSNPKLTTSSSTTSTTPRIVTVTVPKVEASFTRTSKSIERGSTRVGETTRVRQYRKQGTPTNEPIISTTERIKASIKSTTTERNDDLIPTTEKPTSTTKRPRAWNAVHIDKNWQEPTTKSTNGEKITTENPIDSSPKTTKKPRHWNAAYIDKNWQEPANAEKITVENSINSSLKLNKRLRNWNPAHVDKTWQEPTRRADRITETTTTTIPNLSNKFEKKANKYSVSSTTEKFFQTTEKPLKVEDKSRRRDFRSRTATYRRHLESQVSRNSQEITKDRKSSAEWIAEVNKRQEKIQIVTPEVEKKEIPSVAITPRYHALIKADNSTQQSVKQEPAVSLLSNATESKVESDSLRGLPNSTGITSISRGSSGNSDSNIFNPTKTTYLISSNTSLLEQLRSTVAPLLSVLGGKTPEFAAAYSKINNASLSVPRVTPSGSPPRFSAKYRGVEFFVRKPSGTNSTGVISTTPLSVNQAKKPSIPVSISSPGEPNVLTYYQALETVNINNEIEQHLGGIGKVDASTIVTDRPSNDSNNAYNYTTETIVTTVEPVVTIITDNDNDNLTVVMDSPNLDTTTQPDITTTAATTYTITTSTSSSTASTQTVDSSTNIPETTEINPSPFNPEFINNSSIDAIPDPLNTTPILVNSTNDNYLTTEMNTEVSITSEADALTTSQGITTTSEETSTDSSITEEAIKVIMASLEDKTSFPESTTSDSITLTTLSTTDVSIQTTESIEATSTTEVITNELNSFKALPDSLEVRSQLGETLTTEGAVMEDQTSMETPEIYTSTESLKDDQTTSIVETTMSLIDFNETSDAIMDDASRPIDDALLSLMMKRLMDIFSLDENSTLLKDISKISDKPEERIIGGFLDNRDLTELDNDVVGTTENSVESSTMRLDNTIEQNSPTVKIPEILNQIATTVEPTTQSVNNQITTVSNPQTVEIETMNPREEINEVDMTLTRSTTYSSTDVTTNNNDNTNNNNNNNNNNVMTNFNSEITTTLAYSELADDTNVTTNFSSEVIATTLEPEVIETTPNVEALDSVPTSPGDIEVTTNPSTTTTTTRVPETTTTSTEDPNSVTTFQDKLISTAQTTASFQQTTTTQLPTSTTTLPSSESTTASIPDTTILSSTTESTLSIPTTTDSPTSATESTTVPITTQSLPSTSSSSSSSSSLSSSSSMPTTTTTTTMNSEMMTTVSSTEMQSNDIKSTESLPTTTTPTTTTTTPATTTTTTTTTTTSTTVPTTAYSGRFGGSRMTPAPRLSSSSSTKTPLRDYHVYGIYPNKTIVRKRPEDNLIDARNIDSPYVIFGIFPDGKLVRKFPNGTVIPDPPSNPVEVVFSLSTSTTTNRPTPQTQVLLENNTNNNQANNVNQPMNNNNGSAIATFNNRPANMTLLTNISGDQINDGYRSQINLGLADNSINSNGADEDPNQFADPTLMPGIGNVNTQPTTTTMVTDASSRTAGPPLGATPSSVNSQGGRIIQDIERDKASRTKEAGGQRSTVYIGQEKFINYWTNDTQPSNNSRISASHQGPDTSSLPSLDILTNNNIQGPGTAQENNRWKDPLDQIFGITTRPSVPSNTLQDESRSAITARPINPLSEVLTPVLDANQLARDTSITITDATTNTISSSSSSSSTTFTTTTPTTTITTTTTTTPPPPTTTTSTSTSTTTTSTTTAATTTSSTTPPTTTTTTTTTIAPTTIPTTTIAPTTLPPPSSSSPLTTTTNTISESTLLPFTTVDVPHQTVFGSTFDDLAFLNSLLQSSDNSNSIGSTPKTLTEVERQLANKILSLALSKVAGPTRSPKAIQPSNVSPNSLDLFPRPSFGHSSSSPIIIDLLEPTSKKPVARITTQEPFTWKPVTDVTSTTPTTTTTSSKPTVSTTSTTTSTTTTTTTPASTTTSTTSTSSTTVTPSTQVTWKPFPKQPPTLKYVESIPVTTQTSVKAFTGKPIYRPKSTTPPPLGFGASLLQAIFGRNIFAPSTTQRPVIRRPVQTTTMRPTTTTSRPIQTTEFVIPKPAVRNQVQAASQQNDVRLLNSLLGDTKVSTSTFSPEDDAKFLLELLKDTEKNAKKGVKGSSVLSQDDETFLRSILSGQAKVRTPSSVSGNSESNNAALLAQLLKVQGIEPSTPANRLQEQLQGIKVTSMPTIQTTARVIATTKKSVTRPRPSDWQPTSTYPPPLFSNFNFGFPRGESDFNDDDNSSRGGVRNQVLNAAIGATRVFSQFLGAAITGAAQQLQSFVRNSTKYVTGAVGG